MSRKSFWAFVVVVSFMLLAVSPGYARESAADQDDGSSPSNRADATASATTQGSFLTPIDKIAPFDGLDIWKVTCNVKTTICADVADQGFKDNSLYVSTVCTTGKGDMESTDGGNSNNACANNCKTALVSFHCEDDDFCDTTYDSLLQCINQGGVVQKTQDKD